MLFKHGIRRGLHQMPGDAMRKLHNMRHVSGFSLIELMIAMVIGLIVIGAVLALVMSMITTNNRTIQSIRLTQELRATAAVITSELQRAGSAENPFNVTAASALGTVTISDSNKCITYSYADIAGTTVSRAVSISGGAVYVGTTACGAGGTKLSSTNVTINGMTFLRSGRRIDVTLTGTLPSDSSVTRSYTQSIFAPGLGV